MGDVTELRPGDCATASTTPARAHDRDGALLAIGHAEATLDLLITVWTECGPGAPELPDTPITALYATMRHLSAARRALDPG